MRYQFQSTGRPISHRNGWSFRVYTIPLRKSRTGVKSRPGATTGVNSRWGDSHRHDILWWYHVNKCRAMRGNRSELAAARKSPRCHVNTPLNGRLGSLRNDDGDSNENGKKATGTKQQLCTCITLFCTFLCCRCTTTR